MGRYKSKAKQGRNIRLADQVQKDLAGLIQREIDVSRAGLITLTGVDLSADYAHAKVYFTVLGAEPEVATAALNERAGWLHSLLFKMMHTHTVPSLVFIHDEGLVRGMELARLIDELNQPSSNLPSDPDDSEQP
ncbi:MAG TPA: 30S ribosome-binding factor RbfA [Burkholderiaceae bacterium]|nr:30S ribosome-binding factor RbfA [Burkholderiaceae bacterium]